MNYRPLEVTQAQFCNPLPGRLRWLSDEFSFSERAETSGES